MVIDAAAAAGIAAVALGLVLTPGPNMLYLVSRSITQGRRAGLVSLLGVAAGFGVYLVAAAAGVASLFAAVPAAYTVLKIAGAAYLLYLAFRALRPGGDAVFAAKELPADPTWRLFTMGLTTNLLNPKIAVLYVALLPQFVDPAGAPVWEQSLALGVVQIVVALTVNALIVCSAATLARVLGGRPSWVRLQRWLMGAVLGALALKLLLDRAPAPTAP
ncbi:MAG: LysE family translocator [Pseudonocardiaceae bacterium]|nr:MAG: LysE family translocator [Pseudonocardiaceae bacterium]